MIAESTTSEAANFDVIDMENSSPAFKVLVASFSIVEGCDTTAINGNDGTSHE